MRLGVLFFALTLPAWAELSLPDASNLDAPAKARPSRAVPVAKTNRPPVSLPLASLPTGPTEGVMRFRNGDSLHGQLVQIDATGQIEWRHPEASDPLRFSIQNVMQINLPVPRPRRDDRANAVVSLTNGDALRGTIRALDATTLTLETGYAGMIPIRREMIRRVEPLLAAETVILDGVGSLADWKRSGTPEGWQIRSGTLVATQYGMIGRDVGLPDQSRVEFDLTWQQPPLLLQVGLYGAKPEGMIGDGSTGGYWFMFAGNNVQFQRTTPTESAQLGSLEVRRFLRAGKVRVGILSDKNTKTIALQLDNQTVKSWSDPLDWAGTGRCLVFLSQTGPDQNLRISNLLVREWSGEIQTGAVVAAERHDVVSLANHDRVTGTVKAIQDQVVTIESAVAPLKIPVERIREILFATEPQERARRMAKDVIAVFHDGGRVTVNLESLGAESLIGSSENFGRLSFQRDVFRELHLHIYDENRGDDVDLDTGAIPPWFPVKSPPRP